MPLPVATISRTRVHTRQIVVDGWRRDDGLWDMEARLTDQKDHDYPLASGLCRKGEALHDMRVRITIDRSMAIHDAVVCSDAVPYPGGCDTIAPVYRQLIGMNLFDGFRRRVKDTFESVRGCSHITELLNLLPTAAIQTLASDMSDTEGHAPGEQPFQLDKCHALATTSETVRRYYPRWFRNTKTGA
ncbi:MAG: DUF2889 domain-containing protein [Rugosibacter sp.]|nr:DUF2889 domain-containing protein [Rugosibacter sp.]